MHAPSTCISCRGSAGGVVALMVVVHCREAASSEQGSWTTSRTPTSATQTWRTWSWMTGLPRSWVRGRMPGGTLSRLPSPTVSTCIQHVIVPSSICLAVCSRCVGLPVRSQFHAVLAVFAWCCGAVCACTIAGQLVDDIRVSRSQVDSPKQDCRSQHLCCSTHKLPGLPGSPAHKWAAVSAECCVQLQVLVHPA